MTILQKPFDSDVPLHKIKAVLKRNQEMQEKTACPDRVNIGMVSFNSKLRTLKHGTNQVLFRQKK